MSDTPPCYSGSTRETPLGSVVSLEASDRLTDLATWGSLTDTSFPAIYDLQGTWHMTINYILSYVRTIEKERKFETRIVRIGLNEGLENKM